MNNIFTFILILFTGVLIGQHNPYTGAIDWTPNSGPGLSNGTFKCGQDITADFNFGITGLDSIPTNIGLTFTVGIAGALEYVGASPGGDASGLVSGPFSQYFSYTFSDASTIIATQIDTIPATGSDPLNPIQGKIEVDVKVSSSASTGDQFVINVNLQVPGTLPGNVQADDNESTTGDVDCPIGEISGFVTVINNAPNDGPLSNVTMELYDDSDNLLATTFTNVNGYYFFDSLNAGTYEVRQIQPAGYISVSDRDESPDATPSGDISDLFDAFAGFPVNNIVPVSLAIDGIDTDNDFVEEPSSLPVELVSFNVEAQGIDAMLLWSTASEINSSHFDIERMVDGVDFEFIGSVKSTGTTTEFSQYKAMDKKLKPGKYYYRLKQVDLDGSFTYTDIRSVEIEGDLLVDLYPNPTTGMLHLNANEELGLKAINVYNNSGRLIKTLQNTADQSYDISDLTSGVYYVHIVTNHATFTKRVIKIQ